MKNKIIESIKSSLKQRTPKTSGILYEFHGNTKYVMILVLAKIGVPKKKYCVQCPRVQRKQGYVKLKKAVKHRKSIVGILRAVHQKMLGCFYGVISTVTERINCVCKIMSEFMFPKMTETNP